MKKIITKVLNRISSNVSANISTGNKSKSESEIILHGRIMAAINNNRIENIINNIQYAEFRVFSQFGDDGIIQFLVNYLTIEKKFFIEFGVEDYLESNTRFLLMNNNWSGLVMDGSGDFINTIINSDYYWKYGLSAKKIFVDKDNINGFLIENYGDDKVGVLHIDIDGNDYWIWKNITVIDPDIVIIEYNSVFGSEKSWTIPYNKLFNRTEAHFSNLYWGASLLSLCDLAKEKSYIFIGTNSAGNNAYFIKSGKQKLLKELSCQDGFTSSKYRESRNEMGELTYISGEDRIKVIKGCDVFNTRTNKIEVI